MINEGTYARQLLRAQSEAAVTQILDDIEVEENTEWVPAGTEQNYSAVFSNTSEPVPSFAELIVNSFDAILMKRYKQKYGEQYDESTSLITVEAAVNDLFDHADKPHLDGECVEVIADGDTNQAPCLTVRDTGEGQPRELFEERFMNIASGRQIKEDWPFAQGRFKMGSSAPLRHSGTNSYKLVISAAYDTPGEWSWSIMRDNRSAGRFEYLKIDGDIGTFTGELSLLSEGGVHEGSSRGQNHGTFTKVYDYDTGYDNPSKHILLANSLRTELERVLVDPAFPFQMHEARGYTAGVANQYVRGLIGRLGKNPVRKQIVGNGDMDRYIRHDFGEPLGERKVRVVLFKDDNTLESDGITRRQKRQNGKDQFVAATRHIDKAVMYNVNGQAHAYERRSFLTGKRGCGYDHIGKDLIVFMDLSDVGNKQRHDRRDFFELFSPSRDQMGETEIAQQLHDELQYALEDDDALQAEEKRRRDELITEEHNEQEIELMESLLNQNPSMRKYFSTGERVEASGTTREPDGGEYTAPRYPTQFDIIETRRRDGDHDLWDEANGMYTHEQPTNRARTILFELNAPNDYFDRASDPGGFDLHGANTKRWSVNRGVLSVTVKPAAGARVDETERVTALVERPYSDPLRRTFTVKYTEPINPKTNPTGDKALPSHADPLDIPNIVSVYETAVNDADVEWDDMDWAIDGGWGQNDVVAIQEHNEEYSVFVNMDAAPLHHFNQSKNLTDQGEKYVQTVWRMGIMFYSLAEYIELDRSDRDPGSIVPITMRGVAQSMLNQHISDTELERLSH